jgi:hypothetical protein
MIAPWIEQVARLGAPAKALMERSGIRPELLEHPDAVVPLSRALHWAELACQALGSEHLGLQLARETPLERLGVYGRQLSGARTLHE